MLYFLKRIVIVLGFTSFLVFLSIFPNVGYFGTANVDREDVVKVYISPFERYAIVNYTYNITYNPFLFPLTWLRGGGHASGISSMLTLPKSIAMQGPFAVAKWPSLKELEENALISMVNFEILSNFLMLLVITFAIEFTKMRLIFICLVGGIIGFVPGGLFGTIAGLFIGVFIVAFVIVRKNEESRVRQMK